MPAVTALRVPSAASMSGGKAERQHCGCPGLAFLAAFFAWGAFCAAKIGTRAGRLRNQALWGLVAALAGSLFCAQLCIQARPLLPPLLL